MTMITGAAGTGVAFGSESIPRLTAPFPAIVAS
jgi:hypothetical protein